MLSEERQNKIVQLVNENKSMTIQNLMQALDASESTVRRDLGELDSKGLIEKVYGGVLFTGNIELEKIMG